MSSTTLIPLDPASSPQHANRILSISANLLPDELVASRRARRVRSWVLAVCGATVLALLGWYLLADHNVRSANDELESASAQQAQLQRKQTEFAPVVDTQAANTYLTKQLSSLMAGDLQWASLIATLRARGTAAGITVEGVNAQLNNAQNAAQQATTTLPSSSGAATIGKITITGRGPDKPSVARFVDELKTVSVLANPYITNTAKAENRTTFTLIVDILANAQCGRFSTKCPAGGK